MKILIELEIDQEAYDRKYGPGTEWWEKYQYDSIKDGDTYRNVPKPASEYYFAPDKVKANWAKSIKDVLEEGFYDWTQLHEVALKINVTFP